MSTLAPLNLRDEEKRCSCCDETKPAADFYRHKLTKDGLDSRCKDCAKSTARAHYRENQDRARARIKQWRDENPDLVAEYVSRQRKRHPDKARARTAVTRAVRKGRLAKPACCERCGEGKVAAELDGHHADYAKPLEVAWLCRGCHSAEHRGAP